MSFKIVANAKGVKFSIDHQTFTLYIEEDDLEQSKSERHKWYARQLRIALRRLQGSKARNG